jgi:hypothetical protein
LVTVRIRAGTDARVIDCSGGSAYLSSFMRLLPGRRCVLAWPAIEGSPMISGIVVRSAVGELHAERGIVYHAAVKFDTRVQFLREPDTQVG